MENGPRNIRPAASARTLRSATMCSISSSLTTPPRPLSRELLLRGLLQQIRREFGEFRAFAFLQLDVRRNGFRAELADDVVEAVRGRIHVGIVNLVRVPGE